jgi:RND family efflux transporter MFP subunit
MKKRTKTTLILVTGLAVLLFGWQVISRIIKASQGSGRPRGPAPVAVEIQQISRSSIQNIGNFTGSVIPKSQFMISPKISGKLTQLYVNIGDRVTRGQLVAQLDDEEYRQQVIQAEADLQVARANLEEARSTLEVAERELERVKQLHARGISADSELDAARGAFTSQGARVKVAQAQVANREAAYNAAQLRLSYTRIRATWEGGGNHRVVGERFVDQGGLLTVNAPILSILEIDPLIAVIHVSDKDYFKVQVGQKARISTDAVAGETVEGSIARIAPLLQETSREARIEIEFGNPREIFKPGMFINARIEFEVHAEATVVPVSSIVRRNDTEGIFIADVDNEKALFVPVTVGIVSGDMAEILEPNPLEGQVVVLGQHLLIPDSLIILSGEGSEGNSPDIKPPLKKKPGSESDSGERS